MRRLRSLSTRRLTAIVAAVVALAATAAVAQAALNNSPKPQPKALDRAIVDAVNAPPVDGVSARIKFTNALIPNGALPNGSASPILTGATGRVWIAKDGRFRLELQSERGDAQLSSDGNTLTVYDASAKTVYRMALPQEKAGTQDEQEPATLAGVRKGLDQLAQAWTLSGAKPTSTAGHPSYTLRISPKDDGGLLGAGELAWDATHGVPLRAAVYAQGQSNPVLELEATSISYGAINDNDLRVSVPSGVKAVDVAGPAGHGAKPGTKEDVQGVAAVQKQLGFQLASPGKLAGLPRKDVRLVDFGGEQGALSVYGQGLGGIAVIQREAGGSQEQKPQSGRGRDQVQLPQVNIDGATGTELATALGTVVDFERGGVHYTVLGSVPPVAAENAARGLR
jgi:outer membrane lipoprotein-sorting protein